MFTGVLIGYGLFWGLIGELVSPIIYRSCMTRDAKDPYGLFLIY
jgi:hypothetical protein